MDSKKFFDEIRKIIKEEINIALKEKDKKTTELDFKTQVKEFNKMQNDIKTKSEPKNTIIENLLNETRISMIEDTKTLTFTSEDAKGFANRLGYSNSIPLVDINGRQVANLDPSVQTALTKDYSTLMKAIKNKNK